MRVSPRIPSRRLRKPSLTPCLLLLVTATTVATLLLATSPWWVHFLYFLLSGLLWILPAMLIIKWMAGPKPKG